MLIECPYCQSKVDAKVVGERHYYNPPDDPIPSKVSVAGCPSCGNTLVGLQEENGDPECEDRWSEAIRLWPQPKRTIAWTVPDIVKTSLEEADRCYYAGAYSACVVMCGRALEGICLHHNTKSSTLSDGLKELKEKEIIDKRLFTWGDEFRKVRNLGAHASTEKVSKQDARDVLDFTHAITDYVFVLSGKFDQFMERRQKKDLA